MATMALPIRELEQSVSIGAKKAKAETERVVRYSEAPRADISTAVKLLAASVCLKWLFSALVRSQDRLIRIHQLSDLTQMSDEQMIQLARRLREFADTDRELVSKASRLGAETRVWWDASLHRIAEQAEHLDSLAESLELECDPEASTLLGMVLDQFTAKDRKAQNALCAAE